VILSDISVKRPTIAIVFSLLLIVIGIVSFSRTPLRQYPDIDPPVVSIETLYRGAAADIVDTRITQVLEKQLSGLEAVKYISSVSRDGRSQITIEFNIERDVDTAVNEVQQSIGRVLDQLPEEVEAPSIAKTDTNARPMMWFNLTSTKLNALELSDLARRTIVDRLSIVDGVARVFISGERVYAMRIQLDAGKLAARGIAVNDVEDRLRAENVELPAGRVQSENRDLSARVDRIYQTPEDFAGLVLRRGDDGHLVRLGEVADIWLGAENEDNLFRREGRPMVGLGIVKQSQANTVDVARNASAAVAQIARLLPEGTRIETSYDSSIYIDSAITEVYKTLAIAVILVILVIYYFLGNARATIIPAVTVPISLIASFIFVYAMGFSINLLTLLALVLAIGLVVDDTIVMLENIYRRIEEGEPPLLAAYRGARQVGFAVVATTLVLIAVFVPLVFLEGNVGRLFTEFALTIAAAVAFSSIVALTLSPVLCAKVLRRHRDGASGSPMEPALLRFEGFYMATLAAFSRRPVISLVVILLGVGTIFLMLRLVPGEFAPEEDTGAMFMSFVGPEGSSYDRTSKTVTEMEEKILANFDDLHLNRFLIRAPSFFGDTSSRTAVAIIGLVPWDQRDESVAEVRGRLYGLLNQVPGGRVYLFTPSGLQSGGGGQPVQVAIGADTYEELAQWRDLLLDKLENHDVLRNVDIDFSVGAQQVRITVNRDRAAELGVSVAAIGRTLETLLGSRLVTTFMERGEEYNVLVEGNEKEFSSPEAVRDVFVRSERSGALIPLANLVTIEESATALSLPRYNRRRALTLSADIAPGHTMEKALAVVMDMVATELPDSATVDYKGESLEYVQAAGSMLFVFAVALLVSYLVMAAQFESFLHPLLIMLMVPLASAGALLGLWLTGQTLNIFSQIGLVMLIGLAAKNGILIVEFANQLRDQGMAFRDAVFAAARQRLRPILMTSLTTVFGAVPLLLASGAGAEVRYVLGVVIFSGVLLSTLITLYVLPVLYLKLARNSSTPGKVTARIGRLVDAEP